ncbi:hypothetical protein ACFFQ5_14930 [Pseudomonas brassicacearum]|uniref:hypothetical protein n=1 Tax=Pseudomonas brassicacearum TaxID=930166 RepID=UPI00025FE8A1|nr:hypothetical protein [Pseudomonas brassicacearum]EIK70219.1 putative membrane protein [Pseudomonas fluorescens Q8r1-96]KAB0525436.1 hypothetical protein F7R20_14105 [Pseudomonas brassicacearum subsp. brassicacearum]NJP64399.1 hypothetical protein [Pseudomonas brassicacearum]QEO76920.1 hypothetical protein ELZ14_04935 [Pseudomonas brassicacearum]WLG69103.1 hypothetical protein PSH71_04705 [Pseudomonas brassicacearum]
MEQEFGTTDEKQKPASFQQDIYAALKLMAEHWGLIGSLGALISAVLSFGILMTYAKAIDRIDLLPLVFDKKLSALLPWMGVVAFVLFLYMVVMCVTTMFYALAVSFFNQTPNLRPTVARWFFWAAVVGSLIFVAFAFQAPKLEHWIVALVILSGMSAVLGLSLKSQRIRMALKLVSLFNNLKGLGVWWHQAGVFFFAYSILIIAVFAAVYPMLILLKSYTGKDTPEAINSLMVISMVAVVLLFLPALIFFVSKKHIVARGLLSFGSALLVTLVVVATYPGASSTVVFKAAGMMGVRETTPLKYRLLKNFEAKDFDPASWGTVDASLDLPVVEAFPLFSLGDVLLLCPGDLSGTHLGQWPEHSHVCIVTQRSDVVILPGATAAPKQT